VSLVYLITSLPRVDRSRPPPMSSAELARRARAALEGDHKRQLELLLLLDEVDETCRIKSELERADPNVSAARLTAAVRTDRRRAPQAPPLDELPDFILQPLPRHVLLRRTYKHFYDEGGPFVRAWAEFAVDLEEILTGLVARKENLAPEHFALQMEGHFDSTSEIIVGRLDRADLGLFRRFPWMPKVERALALANPQETELALDELRFTEIDRLMGTAPFSLEVVLGTFLILRLLERRASWNKKVGETRLASLLGASLFDADLSSTTLSPASSSVQVSGGAR
jgi:hypothetical protein